MPAGKMLAATPEVAAFFMTAEVGDPEAELALGSQSEPPGRDRQPSNEI
jgi:hypothetical protein